MEASDIDYLDDAVKDKEQNNFPNERDSADLVRLGVKHVLLLDGDLVLAVLVFDLKLHLKGFTNHFGEFSYNVTGLSTRNKRM